MKSVMSFPERGTYGDSKWRGNTSGFVIKELIEHFNPKLFVDACEGSGTSGDVCKEMGIDYVGLDLYKGQDFTRDYILNQLPRPADVCFTHPPYHCLHPDSLVINDSGIPIPIKDYEVGDKTINQYGEIVDVVAVAKKKNTKQIKTIEIEGYSIEPLRVTSDHLCLVLEAKRCKYLSQNRFCNKDCNHLSNKTGSCFNGDAPYHNYKKIWKKAEDIADGDYILYAKPKIKKTDSKIKISDFLDNNNYSLFDDYLYYNGNKNGITKRGKECKYKLKNSIEINETFSYLSGLFISEGSTTFKADGGGTIYFSFHRDEKEYISFVEKAMYEIFEIKGKVRYVKNSKAVRLEFYSKPIAEFLSLLFGKNATLKRIPKVLVYSKENIQKNLIRGLLHGDGCLSQSSFSTTSRTLIEQIRYICFMLGFKFSVHYGNSKTTKVQIHNNKKLSNTSISYYGYLPKNAFNYFYNNIENSWRDRAIRYEDYYGFRIKNIKTDSYEGDVYDIQVSKGESFLTPTGIVHNCMIKYSGSVYGDKELEGDTSHCVTPEEFISKSQVMLLNQREATKEGGIYTTLIGDQRGGTLGSGNFRSYQSDFIQMMPKDELLSVAIKLQHNCLSDNRVYNGNFVPILHEYLLLWRKKSKSLFAVSFDIASELQSRVATTWRNCIRIVMMKLQKADLNTIYAEIEKVAFNLIRNNPNWKAKIRQTLQKHYTNVERGVWALN